MRRKPDLAEHIERFSARGAGAREKADANRAADPEMAAWRGEAWQGAARGL